MKRLSLSSAQAIALAAQGFGRRPVQRPSSRQFAQVLGEMGLVQLDSVNVCVRSHYMPFYARLGPYVREQLDSWLSTPGERFEYWAHEASVLPIASYPLWRWRMATRKPWPAALRTLDEHPGLTEEILRQVRDRGPLSVKELDAPKSRMRPWWGYGPGKVALEVLFGEGKLSARRGKNFSRLYDLPSRSVPEAILADRSVSKDEAHRRLLRAALAHLGVGSARDIVDYYRLKMPACAPLLAEMVQSGEAEQIDVRGYGAAYLDPGARRPRQLRATSLLSPFDPICWHRERAERLFGFHYRIEIYTPKEKRVHGYYVLPFLLNGALVARVDLKADRKARTLQVASAFVEDGQDASHVAQHLAAELERFATWLALDAIELGRRGNLMAALCRALR